jgi:hypothetical protein
MRAELVEIDDRDFENELNDIYGDVEICGLTYGAGTALKEVDPTAFRCAMADRTPEYQCGECGQDYDNEEEAEDCCKPSDDESEDK